MKVCGLTGGVGMGKSTAAGFLQTLGVRIIDTDAIARELVQPNQPALSEIRSVFGNEVISTAGELLRDKLAKIIFADPAARKKLEDILHPKIRERWQAQIEIWRKEKCALAIVVIPLLFETQAESSFEKIICVACSKNSQQQRLQTRGWSPEQIQQRISAQMPADQKIARSHFVIWAEGMLESHAEQARRIFEKL